MPTLTTSDSLVLSYTTRGSGPPVLFIHGFPLHSGMWDDALDLLPPGSGTLIAPDLRGFGRSTPAPPSDRPSLSRYAHDLAELLDVAHRSQPAVVAGLSMGGYIALEFYRLFPGRVRAVVLANTRAGADTPETARAREIQAHAVEREGSAREVAAGLEPKLFAASTPRATRDRWRQVMADAPAAGVAYALRAMATRPDSTPTLPTIGVPVLVVVGDEDRVTPPAVALEMHALLPYSRLEIIPGAGHLTPIEQPGAFADVLGSFLRSVPPVGGA